MKLSTNTQAFTPESDQIRDGLLEGLSFGVRTNYLFKAEGEAQYLVFEPGYNAEADPLARHVLGSGFTVAQAAHSARVSLATRKIKPEFYWGRLAGCTFTSAVEMDNVALQHVCLDRTGRELGRADTRQEAAKRALHRALIDAQDITFAEFSAIAAPVAVDRGGRSTCGATFASSEAQDVAMRMLGRMYRGCEEVRTGAAAMAQAAASDKSGSGDPYQVFRQVCTREILSSLGSAEGATFRLTTGQGDWEGFLVLHTCVLSSFDAMKHAYDDYVSERAGEAVQLRQAQEERG